MGLIVVGIALVFLLGFIYFEYRIEKIERVLFVKAKFELDRELEEIIKQYSTEKNT